MKGLLNIIPNEDLHYLLPRSLREDLEVKEQNFASPSSKKTQKSFSNSNETPKMTPSPQIPPLESRLHSYLLKKKGDDVAKPCNLSQFFNDVCINDEIKNALKDIPHRVKIFEYLDDSGFFEQVKDSIAEAQRSVKSRLNAGAVSFIPDWNKENFCPKLKLSNRFN
jgi:hypothetical protein